MATATLRSDIYFKILNPTNYLHNVIDNIQCNTTNIQRVQDKRQLMKSSIDSDIFCEEFYIIFRNKKDSISFSRSKTILIPSVNTIVTSSFSKYA